MPLTLVQCPCGFRVSAQSIRATSFALEQHAIYTRLSGEGTDHAMEHARLVERRPVPLAKA